MKIVVITAPGFVGDEARKISDLLGSGLVDRVHVRKPGWSKDAVRFLIESVAPELHPAISLHDHHNLATALGIGGVHLNRRNPCPPDSFTGLVSRSCHSTEELGAEMADYHFLSPIFDSISKEGYASRFTPAELQAASAAGIINPGVYALGGVTPAHLPMLRSLGFGGAAMLGAVWQAKSIHEFLKTLSDNVSRI